eukprot:943070-Pelagomonas_calceolata.AAC.1
MKKIDDDCHQRLALELLKTNKRNQLLLREVPCSLTGSTGDSQEAGRHHNPWPRTANVTQLPGIQWACVSE